MNKNGNRKLIWKILKSKPTFDILYTIKCKHYFADFKKLIIKFGSFYCLKKIFLFRQCPTFRFKSGKGKTKSIEIQLKRQHFSNVFWKIHLYHEGWFYLTKHDLDFVPVHVGEDVEVSVNMNQQVQIPLEGIYRYTVQKTTLDCESNKEYSYDQKLIEVLHHSWNPTYSCTIPFLGGLDSSSNFTIYNDPSMYDINKLVEILYSASQTLLKSYMVTFISTIYLID